MPNRVEIALGLDIGGTRIKSVALSEQKEVLLEHRIDSNAKQGPEAIREAVRELIAYYRGKRIAFTRVGVGCAGSVHPTTGVVARSPNFAHWKDVPLKDWVEADAGVPATVGNDANCAVLTEWQMGNAQGHRHVVLLTFGTGIGGGLILDGRLYTGATGTAAELGHFSIHADGIECPCGNRGCFERYCSATSLEKALPGHTAKEIFQRSGEEPFRSALKIFLDDFHIGLTSVANMFDPEIILIGGGLSKGLVGFLPETKEWVRTHAFPSIGEKVKIVQTQHFNQSGAIGAALLAHSLN